MHSFLYQYRRDPLEGEKGKKVRQAAKSKIESEVRAGRAGKNRTDLELHQHDDSETEIDRPSDCPSPPGMRNLNGRGAAARGARAKVKPDT